MKIERNIPLLYIYSVLIKRVSQPIIILYFLINTLNFTQIGILASIMAITEILTEVHGGIFADKYGRKLSLILHSILGIITMFIYFIGNSFEIFLLASLAYGLGGAFITGTRQSFLYDTLKEIKKEKEFKKYNGKMVFYSHLINAFVLLAIPFLYTLDIKLPFLIGILFFTFSLITALFFKEPKKEEITQNSTNEILTALKIIKENKNLFFYFIISMIATSFYILNTEFTQPLLVISGLEIIYFGIIYALMRILLGLGSLFTYKLEKYFSLQKIHFLGLIILGLGLLFSNYGNGILIILAVIAVRFSYGILRNIYDEEITKNSESKNRTTILSIANLSRKLLFSVLILIFGYYADIIGVQEIFMFITILFVLLLILAKIFANPTTINFKTRNYQK